MRAPLLLARTCIRQTTRHVRSPQTQQGIRTTAFNSSPRHSHTLASFLRHSRPFLGRAPPPIKGGRVLLAATAAVLSPAAFIELSEKDDEDDGKTGEQHMLEASRAELAEIAPSWVGSSKRVRRSIWRFFDTWIVEPIATGLRFLHLVIIFVPVIAAVPMIWVGTRSDKRDGERWGTVWWYGFLVTSMERAGAAFIKVRKLCPFVFLHTLCTVFSVFLLCGLCSIPPLSSITAAVRLSDSHALALSFPNTLYTFLLWHPLYCIQTTNILPHTARSMGCLPYRHLPYSTLQHHVFTTLQCPRPLSRYYQEDNLSRLQHAI